MNSGFLWRKTSNTDQNRELVVFGRWSARSGPTLNRAFTYTNIHALYVQHAPSISLDPQLSRSTSLWGHPQLYCGLLFMFSSLTASWDRPLRTSSSVLISSRLTLANLNKPHFSTVDFPGWIPCVTVKKGDTERF